MPPDSLFEWLKEQGFKSFSFSEGSFSTESKSSQNFPQTTQDGTLTIKRNNVNFDIGEISLTHGNYAMPEKLFDKVEMLGQKILDLAKEQNIDLTELPELQEAMGYDTVPTELSASELGSYIVGFALKMDTHRVSKENFIKAQQTPNDPKYGGQYLNAPPDSDKLLTSILHDSNSLALGGYRSDQNKAFISAIGKEVFGDNKPTDSSTDTVNNNKNEDFIYDNTTTFRC